MIILKTADAKFDQLIDMWGGSRISGLFFYEWLDKFDIAHTNFGEPPLMVVVEIIIDEKKFFEMVLKHG